MLLLGGSRVLNSGFRGFFVVIRVFRGFLFRELGGSNPFLLFWLVFIVIRLSVGLGFVLMVK